MSQIPTLMSVTAVYAQAAYIQDLDGESTDDVQELKLSMVAGCSAPYLAIETQRWVVDRPKELSCLVKQFAAQVESLFDANQGV